MSFLTKEQLDKYVRDLASKSPKPTSSSTQPRSSLFKIPPNSPSPSTNSSTLTGERKAGALHGPRSPPLSQRNSLIATTSPRASVVNNNNSTNTNEPTITSIPESIKGNSVFNNSSTVSSNSSISNDDKEKNMSTYKSIDDIVNDLSYPMETKLSFKPTTSPPQSISNNTSTPPQSKGNNYTTTPSQSKGNNYTTTPPQSKGNNYTTTPPQSKGNNYTTTPPQSKGNNNSVPPKEPDDPTKGSYVLSAAFRSYELQNRSGTNWGARYEEAQQKYPPLDKLDKKLPYSPSPKQGDDKNNESAEVTPNSRQNPLDCAGCGKSISGNMLTAMGKKWHPGHFVCKQCGISLEHVAFFENDGNPYCHLDFHELFSPRCGHCETPIEGKSISALGKSWHPGHFFCRECGNPFEGGFMVHEGFPYCEKDWTKLYAPKCLGCKEPIRGEFLNALEGMWHRDCFACTTCKEPFHGSYFYTHEGKPYCDKHYKSIMS
ncbi:10527_t:CDS:2 [Funneliformis geosporum]|uniref:4826_t:CDS:1 n=1 Tax=Funneliformis geosporum TaxID=1117311 RepID=A0A9W4WIN6_9GLOM|nr:4826_t:CDS:2 [Funneliformis geosporum]CAI2169789.1 10527_t:CDS:2 [Funneliformis geosporum]